MPPPDAPNALAVPPTTDLAPPLPGQAAVDEGLVAETLADINATYEHGALATGRAIAAIVLDKMFRDDVGRFLAEADGHASYLALASQPTLRIGKGALWYAVAIEENFALLAGQAQALTVSHHRRLVHVRDPQARSELAGRAVAEGMTVEALEQEIAALAPPRPADRNPVGRPRLPEPAKRFTRVQSAIEKLDDELEGMEKQELAALLVRAEAGQLALARWVDGLRRRVVG